jgi:hypothetical protein
MKKLDELDAYTRTKIKNEIATERVNYVTAQRTAIEEGLNQKIDQKTSLQAIKNEYDPIIAKIHSNIKSLDPFFDYKRIHSQSSIILSSDYNKIISYFPADKRNLLVENIYKGSRDGWSKEAFGQKVFNQGPTIVLVRTKLGAICGGFTSKSWAASGGAYANDNAAFVFNLNEKFIPSNYDKAIYQGSNGNGFIFGDNIF